MALNQAIISYIREHVSTYTREAITQELLKAGFEQAEIEATWQAFLTDTPQSEVEAVKQVPPNVSTAVARQRPGLRFWMTVVGYGLVVIFLAGLLIFWNHLDVAIAFLIIATLAGIVSANIMFNMNPGEKRAISITLMATLSLLFVISVVFPFVILVIVAGLCVIGWSVVPW